jgi:hypothetical protein
MKLGLAEANYKLIVSLFLESEQELSTLKPELLPIGGA